jgi:hypothetical protein
MLSRFADSNGWSYLDPAAQDNEPLGCGFDVGHSDAQHVRSTAGISQGVPAAFLGHGGKVITVVQKREDPGALSHSPEFFFQCEFGLR